MTAPLSSRRLRPLAVAIVIAVASGCEAAASPSASVPDVPAGVQLFNPQDLRYTCGEFGFKPEILDQPGSDEQADNPMAAALRVMLAPGFPEGDWLPDSGWHLVGVDADSAEFVAPGADGPFSVSVGVGPAGWTHKGWGGCHPQLVLPAGIGIAEWQPDPADGPLGPQTRTFGALVTERACASGKPPNGRVVGPTVALFPDRVLIVFGVREQGGAHNCQSNPSIRVAVDLGEPLGNRRLVDPALLPPAEFP